MRNRPRASATVISLVSAMLLAFAAFPSISFLPAARAGGGPEAGPRTGLLPTRTADAGLRLEAPDRSAAALPDSVDLSAGLPPVGNQGRQGSCAAWSTGYYMKTWWEKKEHPGWDLDDPEYRMSPSFLYNQVNGGRDMGSSFPDIMTVLQVQGDTDIAEFPYDDADYTTRPTAAQVEMAGQYRIPSDWGYFFVNDVTLPPDPFHVGPFGNDVTRLKRHLASGEPLVLGIPIFDDFPDIGGEVGPEPVYLSRYDGSNPPAYESLRGGHGLCAVGYDDNANPGGATPYERGGIMVVNSWGPGWNGAGAGYVYLSYEFVRDWAWEAWAMRDQDSSPVVDSMTPPNAATGQTVTFTGRNFGGNRRESRVTFTGAPGSQVVSWTNTSVIVKVPGGAETGYAYVHDWDSERSNGKAFTADPMGASWLMAEGCTRPGFDEWVLLQNPNSSEARTRMCFLTPGGRIEGPAVAVPPRSRVSVHVNDYVPGTDVATMVTGTNGVGICAERAMYMNTPDGKRGSHDCIASKGSSTTWFLAEGCTLPGFDEWLTVMNPNDVEVGVSVTYQTPGGALPGPEFRLAPGTRGTVHVNEQVPDSDVSATVECTTAGRGIVAERSMYMNTPDGKVDCHNSLGTTWGEPGWGLAEGCTLDGFEEWVLVQNPGSSPVTFDLFFLTPGGAYRGPSSSLGPGRRMSLRVNDYLPGEEVSVEVITADEEQLVVVERAMYVNGASRTGAHNAPASAWMSKDWVLPEGATWPGFEEWVLVMNPTGEQVSVTLTFMTPSGAQPGPTGVIDPFSRSTFRVNDYVGTDVSTRVTGSHYIIAERAMYMSAPDGKCGATGSLGVLGSQVLEGSGAGPGSDADYLPLR